MNSLKRKREGGEDLQLKPQPPSHHRMVEDKGDYMVGSIVRIRMRSFLTYDDCEVEPGPRLNVVVGPNGTGKSTIVCAIAIGLGANPKVLGRGTNEKDYIKHGANFGELEIELKGSEIPATREGNIVVYHKISKEQQPEWRMGTFKAGRALRLDVSSRPGVKTRVAKLNVQIDNLCQFLPQDRVSAFASLNEKDLLWETLKAVGKDERLFNDLASLIRMQKNIEAMRHRIDLDQMALESDKTQNRKLQVEIDRYHERLRHLMIVKLCDSKKPMIELETLQKEHQEAEQKKISVDGDIARYNSEIKPVENEILQTNERVRVEHNADLEIQNQISSSQALREKFYSNFNQLDNKIEAVEIRIATLQTRKDDKKKEVRIFKELINEKQRALETLPSRADVEQNIAAISGELLEFNKQGAQENDLLETKKRQNYYELRSMREQEKEDTRQYERLKSKRQMREKMIQQQSPDTYRAYMWVKNNRKLFKADLLGPLALEIEVERDEHAIFVEKALGKSMLAFIAQNEHDEGIFQKELFEKQALRLTLIKAPSSFRPPQRKANLNHMKKYGITCWLDTIWTAPEVVKNTIFVNNMFMFHSVVGTPETLFQIEQFLGDSQCTKVTGIYAGNTVYQRSRSEYSNLESIKMETLANKTKYLVKGDRAMLEKLELTLKQHRDRLLALQKESDEYTKKQEAIEKQIRDVKKKKMDQEKILGRRGALEQNIQLTRQQLDALLHEDDPEEEIVNLEQQIAQTLLAQKTQISEINKHNQHLLLLHKEKTQKKIRETVEKAKLQALKALLQRMQRKNEQLFLEFKMITAKLEELTQAVRKQQSVVKKHLQSITEEEKQKFHELPSDLEELQVLRQSSHTKAQVNTSTNAEVIKDFEQREKAIKNLEEQTAANKMEIGKQQKEMKALKGRWSEETKEIIGRLSGSFTDYMRKIGCDGSVKLHTPQDKFTEYGVQMMVKFRKKAKLQQLKGMMQSGGEKSVATMLYLVSLQPLTPCPFRLVDEINQGMDACNERMIFEQVVNSASSGGGKEVPQYFLITPKLLPDLKFKRHMRVLCILNGPWQDHLPAWPVSSVAAALGEQKIG